jgi:hypothetical protein
MKKTIFTTLLLLPLLAMAQTAKLPDSISITKPQYIRIDSLIQATVNKLALSELPSNKVQQMISDIQFTLQVIGYQIQLENKKQLKKKP